MKHEHLYSLVDLYVDNELPEELCREMEEAAGQDPALAAEIESLDEAKAVLKAAHPAPEFTEESFQRILMTMVARGADIRPRSDAPLHLQYQLPMLG
jgi:anti-sigma factor RsiW